MATIPILGTSAIQVTSGGDSTVARIRFQVTAASGLSMKPQAYTIGGDLTATNLVDVSYVNAATGAVVAAGTAITANGLYEVDASGWQVYLLPSAGTATVTATPLAG